MTNREILRALLEPETWLGAAVLVAFVVAFGALLWMVVP